MHFVLSEPAVVGDIYASGIAEVDAIGEGNYRFTLYATQRSNYDPDTNDNIIVCRIIMPTHAILRGIEKTFLALGCQGAGIEKLRILNH